MLKTNFIYIYSLLLWMENYRNFREEKVFILWSMVYHGNLFLERTADRQTMVIQTWITSQKWMKWPVTSRRAVDSMWGQWTDSHFQAKISILKNLYPSLWTCQLPSNYFLMRSVIILTNIIYIHIFHIKWVYIWNICITHINIF